MKKMTRAMLLAALAMGATTLVGCGGKSGGSEADYSNMKVGLMLLHPAASSTYDKNFREAAEAASSKLGFTLVVKENIDETDQARQTAEELAADGCDIVFGDSFGHEDFMLQAAERYPEVEFCHATGTQAASSGKANFHNAFAAIYEGRYLAGVVAGQKMAEDIAAGKYTAAEAKVGYVGAHPYAEVISGFTSFYLGVRSVVAEATMVVTYTNFWYNYTGEYNAAKSLIENQGVKLVSQHADSFGAPKACEENSIPNVAYNGATDSEAPETYLVSSKINWEPYFEYIVKQAYNNEAILTDYVGTVANGDVQLTKYGKNVSAEAKNKVETAKTGLANGTLKVFDTSKFTVGGQTPSEENMAPSKQWTFNYPEGTQFVKDGYYHESEYRSAPSFDVIIDGITTL